MSRSPSKNPEEKKAARLEKFKRDVDKAKSKFKPVEPAPPSAIEELEEKIRKPMKGFLKTVDFRVFEELCFIHCTQKEILSVLGVTRETLDKQIKAHYGAPYNFVYAVHQERGKASLRRIQWRQAQQNTTMSIWLGKQYLDQREDVAPITNYRQIQNELKDLRLEPRPMAMKEIAIHPEIDVEQVQDAE